ncbi:NlpC/P60 family protein [Leekyejoonella antrihumi]|uniref:NlpC/P60 family protein n=2 Tax=Leekyejoonella antrihumi TaxID=1660198 RepID=A0A563DZU7_9MICO|nr:NlpC/P60 family protein [Leekyejoonella antrihumi]
MSSSAQQAAATTLTYTNAKTLSARYESGAQTVDLTVRSVAHKAVKKAVSTPVRTRQTVRADRQQRSEQQTSRSATRPSPAPARQPKAVDPAPAPKPKAPPVSAPSRSGAVGIAMRYIGVPYVYGGTSPAGFDCSGLTQYVYAQLGISIPRTASAQQASMQSVSNPQPGDLVFFGYPAYHVGIYAGNGEMIAAPKPGGSVQLQKIWDTPSGYGRP